MPTKLLVDADACPVTRIVEKIAREYGLLSTLVCDTSHIMQSDISEIVIASKGRDCADFVLLKMVEKGDVVVTQDYGLAALCLAKGAYAINQNGMEYTSYNMDSLLTARHIGAKTRRAGGRTKGPKKRTPAQDEAFESAFRNLVERIIK